MKLTFLIGNGFDLSCGLKSSYADVYEEYIKVESRTEVIKKFKQDLIANKTKEKWGNWSDFEMGMAAYAKNFKSEKELIECVSDFKMFLEKHLSKEEIRFVTSYNKIIKEHKGTLQRHIQESVYDYYKGLTRKLEKDIESIKNGDVTICSFVNFNYTSVLSRVLSDNIYVAGRIINIHGDLLNKDVILGVDNVEQVQVNFNLTKKGKRFFIKPYLNNEYDPSKIVIAKDAIEKSDCICLFGLSLGDSDLTWKNELIKWLTANKNHHLFIFDYECSKKDLADIILKLNEEEDYKEEKMNFLGLSEKQELSEQIHLPIGKKIFMLKEIIDKYINEQKAKDKTA